MTSIQEKIIKPKLGLLELAKHLCRPSVKRYTSPSTRRSGHKTNRTNHNPFSATKAELSVRSSLKFYNLAETLFRASGSLQATPDIAPARSLR